MARTVRAVLPLDIDARSEGLQGTIRIIGIDNLQFGDKYLSCRLHVAGSDLRIVSELAGHQINLKVGEVESISTATPACVLIRNARFSMSSPWST